jgi:hypothetical protein
MRLQYLASEGGQKHIRADAYASVIKAVAETPVGAVTCGKPVILPSSYTGGPRYMNKRYREAMAIVRVKGKPTFFVTMTCNPKWKEIEEACAETGCTAADRPDIVSRVFKLYLTELRRDIMEKGALGKAVAYLDVIEFQKRGLPHAHILVILKHEDRIISTDDIDAVVCAELPVRPKRTQYDGGAAGDHEFEAATGRFVRLRCAPHCTVVR